ncbi:MAG: nucleoside hydrolase [Clostridia bacterium]|nr:nucleoside hydrolase [Clostridia bacterium]
MTIEQRLRNLEVPKGKIDVVLDTDAFNEVDDQFAIAYLLRSEEKLNTVAIYAAPFFNWLSKDAEDGMEKSYNEILKVLSIMGEEQNVIKGSRSFMSEDDVPVISDAAKDLAERAEHYSPENPLYVVATGAITNVASALLINPKVAENTVVVWLGGHGQHYFHAGEFNMRSDYSAARAVFKSGVPFVQVPCFGVSHCFTISRPDFEKWFINKSPIAHYLADNTIRDMGYDNDRPWGRVIWDVIAVAWLLNENERFMKTRIIPTPIPTRDSQYAMNHQGLPMRYVYFVERDNLLADLIEKLTKE